MYNVYTMSCLKILMIIIVWVKMFESVDNLLGYHVLELDVSLLWVELVRRQFVVGGRPHLVHS